MHCVISIQKQIVVNKSILFRTFDFELFLSSIGCSKANVTVDMTINKIIVWSKTFYLVMKWQNFLRLLFGPKK